MLRTNWPKIWLARLRLAFRVPLDTDLERANYRVSVLEGALASVTIQVVATFTPVFALQLGATNQQVGLFYSLPFLFNITALLVTQRFLGEQADLVRWGQGAAFIHRLLILLFITAPLLGALSVWWIVGLYSIASAVMAVSSVLWQGISSDMFPESTRGAVFGTRAMYTGLAGLLSVTVAGKVLDVVSYPANFTLVFVAVALIGFLAAYYYGRLVPPPESDVPSDTSPLHVPSRRPKLRTFLPSEHGKRFLRLTSAVALFNLGFHLASPIATLYYVEHLELSNAVIGILSAVAVLFQVAGSFILGHLADRFGNGTVLAVSAAVLAVQVAVFAAVPSVAYLTVVQAVGGFALGGYNVATLNALFTVGDRRQRPQLIVWYNVAVGLASFLGPQIGTFLLDDLRIAWVFAAAGGVRLLGTFLMLHMARRDFQQTRGRRSRLRVLEGRSFGG